MEADSTRTKVTGVRQVTAMDFVWDGQKGAVLYGDSFDRSINLFNLTTNEKTVLINQVRNQE